MNALQKRPNAPSQMLSNGTPMEQVSGGRNGSKWLCHKEERSKLLGIVDVKLKEGQVAPSFTPKDSTAITMDNTGYGRLNCCPRMDHDRGDTTNIGGGQKKRRKLAMVPEDARTVRNLLSLLYCQARGTVLSHLALIRTNLRLNNVRDSSVGNATADLPIQTECPPRLCGRDAALWGNVNGVQEALSMGANPLLRDAA